MEQREKTSENTFPAEVKDVIAQGNYVETFLQSYDGQSFLLHSEEIVPGSRRVYSTIWLVLHRSPVTAATIATTTAATATSTTTAITTRLCLEIS